MPETPINYESPYDATSLITFLKDPVTQAFAWKLTPRASSPITNPIGATSHTKSLTLPGHGSLSFRTNGGIIPTAIDNEAGQEGAGAQFDAVFDDTVFTKAAVNAGDWNGAKLEIYLFNYKATKMGQLIEFAGRLGTVREEGGGFRAEARQLASIARLKIGRLVTAGCDVKRLGDSRCKLNLAPFTRTAQVVTSVPSAQNTFRASGLSAPTVAYAEGLVTFTSGLNNGREFPIKSFDNATKEIVLHTDTPFAIATSDQFTIVEGCARNIAACVAFANIMNYRGFPYITNIEEINRIERAA